MPKNKSGGKKWKKKKNDTAGTKQEIIYKGECQGYAQITRSLGNDFMGVTYFTDGRTITKRAHIPGTLRRRVMMGVGDIVLISFRPFQDDVCDIILKYTNHEARILKSQNEIPVVVDIGMDDDLIDNVVFEDETKAEPIAAQTTKYDLPEIDSDANIDDL